MDTAVMDFRERRTGADRRSGEERRTTIEAARVKAEGVPRAEKRKTHLSVLEVAGSAVMAALGLYVYQATGLYGAAEAGIVKFGLGALIASWFVLNFRMGLHQR